MSATNDPFALSTRPDSNLFYKRNETGDPRLGERVRSQPEDYAGAKVVLLGCPQDDGVRRNGGRVGAKNAPDAIRACLYKMVAPEGVALFDLGNTVIHATLEETHAIQQQIVRQVLSDGKTLISLGGGNDLSYPDCAALSDVSRDTLAFNVDAHLDVRDNSIRNSGTPYRMLLEEGYLQGRNFHEMGYQPFAVAQSHLQYLHDKGAVTRSLPALRARGILTEFQEALRQSPCTAIFWGIDLDSVRASDAPGVSAPNPLGLTGEELCLIAELAGTDPRIRVFELTEVNPIYDIDQRTCRLAAVAIFYFLSAFYSRIEGVDANDNRPTRDATDL